MTAEVEVRKSAARSARVAPGGLRVGMAAGLALGALLLIAEQAWYRGEEVVLAGAFIRTALGYGVFTDQGTHMLYFRVHDAGPTHFMGLGLSLGCSSVLLAAPVVFMTALLVMASRIPLLRLVAAAVVVTGIEVSLNVLRIALIAVFVNAWGVQTGFGWAHSFFGTVLTLVGLSVAMLLYVFLVRGFRGSGARERVAAV